MLLLTWSLFLFIVMKTVVIKSVANARPGAVMALAEAFGLAREAVAFAVYNAPYPFLKNLDETTAAKAQNLLNELGFETGILNDDEPLPKTERGLDVAVYIHEPEKIFGVAAQLADFLGLTKEQAVRLLMQYPAVVLGNVSLHTAQALQNKIDAEVMVSNPRKATYTIMFSMPEMTSEDKQEILFSCQSLGLQVKNDRITGISFDTTQEFVKRCRCKEAFRILNEDFTRYRVMLTEYEQTADGASEFLKSHVGMPDEVIAILPDNLPVYLMDSLSGHAAAEFIAKARQAGLRCIAEPIPFDFYRLKINFESAAPRQEVEKLLNAFFGTVRLMPPYWISPRPLNHFQNRFLMKYLQGLGVQSQPVME